jgi:serine/threonine protein kinase
MATVYLSGKRLALSPSSMIGKGGEADIYDLGDGNVLKLYKKPDDPDYMGNPVAQQGARERLSEYQRKLPAFSSLHLPAHVVSPKEVALTKQGGDVAGYTMTYLKDMEVLLRLGDRRYREQGGIDGNQVVNTFANLHSLVGEIHRMGVVIGDFNDLNVLLDAHGQVYLVDADSMQFGGFYCRTFTSRFVDPLLTENQKLILTNPHTTDSDWYAFNVMLFQSLLFVGPYGGVHKPAQGKRLQHDARVLQRLTVFKPEVLYPKPALPYDHLPDDLLEHFRKVYENDMRGEFPTGLIKALRWTTCLKCGAIHARARCPACAGPGAVVQTIIRRGTVTATSVFRTTGRILQVAHQGGKLRYLYHENGAFRREGAQEVIKGNLDPELRFRLSGDVTILGKRKHLFVFSPGEEATQLDTDAVNQLSIFDANDHAYFWLASGQLVKSGKFGSEYVGDILPGRTLFWTGNKFGLGFYQAGALTRTFVFNTTGRGLNDRVALPTIPGQMIDATCVFSDQLAWLMLSIQNNGRLVNHCFVVNKDGEVTASAEANQDEDSWLADGIRGRFAAGSSLFASTDYGIVRISAESGAPSVAQTFPDTEPFVDATTKLIPGDGGIYAVSGNSITLLKIK